MTTTAQRNADAIQSFYPQEYLQSSDCAEETFEGDCEQFTNESSTGGMSEVIYHPFMYVYQSDLMKTFIEQQRLVYQPWPGSDQLCKSHSEAQKLLRYSKMFDLQKQTYSKLLTYHHVSPQSTKKLPEIVEKYMEKLEEVSKECKGQKSVKVQMFFPDGKRKALFLKTNALTSYGTPLIVKKYDNKPHKLGEDFDLLSVHDLLWWDYGSQYDRWGINPPREGSPHYGLYSRKLKEEEIYGGQVIPLPSYVLIDESKLLVMYWNSNGTTAPENVWACNLFLSTGLNLAHDVAQPLPFPKGPVILALYCSKEGGIVDLDEKSLLKLLSDLNGFRNIFLRKLSDGLNIKPRVFNPRCCVLSKFISTRYFADGGNFRDCATRSDLLGQVNGELENIKKDPALLEIIVNQAGYSAREFTEGRPMGIKEKATSLLLDAKMLFSLSDLCSLRGSEFDKITLTLEETTHELYATLNKNRLESCDGFIQDSELIAKKKLSVVTEDIATSIVDLTETVLDHTQIALNEEETKSHEEILTADTVGEDVSTKETTILSNSKIGKRTSQFEKEQESDSAIIIMMDAPPIPKKRKLSLDQDSQSIQENQQLSEQEIATEKDTTKISTPKMSSEKRQKPSDAAITKKMVKQNESPDTIASNPKKPVLKRTSARAKQSVAKRNETITE